MEHAPETDADLGPRRLFWARWSSDGEHEAFELHTPWWAQGFDDLQRPIYLAAFVARSVDEVLEAIYIATRQDTIHGDVLDGGEALDEPWDPEDDLPQHDWMAWDPEAGVTCACPLVPEPHDHTVGRPGDKVVVGIDLGSEDAALVSIPVRHLRTLVSFAAAGANHHADPPEVQADKTERVQPALDVAREVLNAFLTASDPTE